MDLITYRESLGLTQEQAANQLDLNSKGYFSRLERGEEQWPLRLALKAERWSDGHVAADSLVALEDAELLASHRALAVARKSGELAARSPDTTPTPAEASA